MNQYLQNGWEGLSPEAQNAINQLKTMQTDWNDILFRDAFTQEYNISIQEAQRNNVLQLIRLLQRKW